MSPQEMRDVAFATIRRGGYDPVQVDAFKTAAADAMQKAVQDATAMEARARAAVARLQELSQAAAPSSDASAVAGGRTTDGESGAPPRGPSPDESETISRTLLLAQRTADATVAEAKVEAETIIETAKAESRRAGEAERARVEGEVQALLARRDFLESDVDQLEQHLAGQRQRVGEIVAQLEGVGQGLVPGRRPQLSASDQESEVPYEADAPDEADVATLIDEVVETAPADSSAEIARVTADTPEEAAAHHSLFDADADAGER